MNSPSASRAHSRSRWVRFPLLAAVSLLAAFAPLSMDRDAGSIGLSKAMCHDCRPASGDWMCHHRWGTCPLNNQMCVDLPL